MNNPADAPKGANIASDELAALARKVNGVRVRWPEMDTSDDSLEEVEASLRALASLKGEAEPRKPDGYAYRYPHHDGDTVIRFTCGQEINGARPIEAVPYFYDTPPAPQAVREAGKWYCPVCDLVLLPRAVTFEETHDERVGGCGNRVTPITTPSSQAVGEVNSHWSDLRIAENSSTTNPSPAPQGGGDEKWCSACGDGTDRTCERCEGMFATPPAQQPGEVGEADYKEAYSRMVAGAEKALDEIEDAGPKALKYAAQEIRDALQSADAALAPKEKGNG